MHLVEDAAVPDHTRNDIWHGPKAYFLNATTLETWTDANIATFLSLPVQTFNNQELSQVFGTKGAPQAPVPVSRLIDADICQPGERPNIGGATLAGVAEYSNSNFLSDATVFEGYEYPSLDSTEPIPGALYLRKIRDGEAIEHFVGYDELDKKETYTLDTTCYYDYAKLLVPKAIAYASLIPYYFFRPLEVTKNISCSCWEEECWAAGDTWIRLFNHSTEPIVSGQLEIYSIEEGAQRLVDTVSIGYLPPCVNTTEDGCMPYLSVNLGSDPSVWYSIAVVFRGTLGLEEDAVMAGYAFGGCTN